MRYLIIYNITIVEFLNYRWANVSLVQWRWNSLTKLFTPYLYQHAQTWSGAGSCRASNQADASDYWQESKRNRAFANRPWKGDRQARKSPARCWKNEHTKGQSTGGSPKVHETDICFSIFNFIWITINNLHTTSEIYMNHYNWYMQSWSFDWACTCLLSFISIYKTANIIFS